MLFICSVFLFLPLLLFSPKKTSRSNRNGNNNSNNNADTNVLLCLQVMTTTHKLELLLIGFALNENDKSKVLQSTDLRAENGISRELLFLLALLKKNIKALQDLKQQFE